jgi:hypothetical protein
MNRLIVKPMPHSTLTPKTCPQLAPAGALAQPSRTIAQTQPKTPSVLPTSRPAVMPSDTGCSRSDQLRPASDTPALAKANIGSTRKATQGCRPCSSASAGEWPSSPSLGMNSAVATPASVACTPDFSTQTHITRPITM